MAFFVITKGQGIRSYEMLVGGNFGGNAEGLHHLTLEGVDPQASVGRKKGTGGSCELVSSRQGERWRDGTVDEPEG